MNEQVQTEEKKDYFVLYLALAAVAMVGTILAVKLNENQKFEPIKQQIEQEHRQMNIRIIGERED